MLNEDTYVLKLFYLWFVPGFLNATNIPPSNRTISTQVPLAQVAIPPTGTCQQPVLVLQTVIVPLVARNRLPRRKKATHWFGRYYFASLKVAFLETQITTCSAAAVDIRAEDNLLI